MPTNVLNFPRDYYYANVVSPSNPAAGNPLIYSTTQRALVQPNMVTFLFTSAVAVANRFVWVAMFDAFGNPMYQVFAPVPQTASLAWTYYFIRDLGSAYQPTGSLVQMVSLPTDVATTVGGQILVGAVGIQAADQISTALISFRGWPTAL